MRTRSLLLSVLTIAAITLAGCSSSGGGDSNGASPTTEGLTPTPGHPVSQSLPTSVTPPEDAAPIGGVAAITAGAYHTCSLDQQGGVLCWGDDEVGQLGDSATQDRAVAATVVGLEGDVTQISGGYYHTCAVVSGEAWCWGRNGSNEAAVQPQAQLEPAEVAGLPAEVTAVAGGRLFTCAIASGKVWCWGDNKFSQVGDGTTQDVQTTPVQVAGLDGNATSIGAGWYHTCALNDAATVECWGNNQYGSLGNGQMNTARVATPVTVEGLTNVKKLVVGGGHACVLTAASGVKCWGVNNYGQLGDGTTMNSAKPVDVVGLQSGVVAVASGTGQNCALLAGGGVKCWGHDWYGELGDGTSGVGNIQPQLVDVRGLPAGVSAIAMGRFHTCALTEAGAVWCWGRNGFGELGDGTRARRLSPTQVLRAS